MDEEEKQSGSGYSLRDKPRPNYKTMHHGDDKFEQDQSYDHHDKGGQSSGAVGGESDDEDYDLFPSAAVATQEDYEREMMKGQAEMRRLQEEETGPPGIATKARPACHRRYLYSSIACRST